MTKRAIRSLSPPTKVSPLSDAPRAASIPVDGLPLLGAHRLDERIRVRIIGLRAWLYWPDADRRLIDAIHAVPDAIFFVPIAGQFVPLGEMLPTGEVPPSQGAIPLSTAIVPMPLTPEAPPTEPITPIELRLIPVSDRRERTTTGLRVSIERLAPWVNSATTYQLSRLRASTADGMVLLRGSGLPLITEGTRFWGERLLIPLGLRPDPDWDELTLREVFAVDDAELLLWDEAGAMRVPLDAFQPLTRAGFRRLIGGNRGHD